MEREKGRGDALSTALSAVSKAVCDTLCVCAPALGVPAETQTAKDGSRQSLMTRVISLCGTCPQRTGGRTRAVSPGLLSPLLPCLPDLQGSSLTHLTLFVPGPQASLTRSGQPTPRSLTEGQGSWAQPSPINVPTPSPGGSFIKRSDVRMCLQ